MALFDSYLKTDQASSIGEDTWELFEAIEDSFGVNLGDYHQYLGLTVKELAEEIAKRANYPTREKCLSAVSFYRLRRAFSSSFDIPRAKIRLISACRFSPNRIQSIRTESSSGN